MPVVCLALGARGLGRSGARALAGLSTDSTTTFLTVWSEGNEARARSESFLLSPDSQ